MNLYKSYRALNEALQKEKLISGSSHIVDLLLTKLVLKIPYYAYLNLNLYRVPWKKRKNYLFNELEYALKFNPGVTASNHDDKIDLMNKLKPYVKRKMVSSQGLNYSEFVQFVDNLKSFFYKPCDGDGGHGIKKFKLSEYKSVRELYDEIIELPKGILEETIKQHKDLNKLCPNVVQTLRFTIFNVDGEPRIAFVALRTAGNKNAFVDNASSGGLFVNVDPKSGRICTNAFCILSAVDNIEGLEKDLKIGKGLVNHPVSGLKLMDYKIPFFEEAKNLVFKITKEVNFYNRKFLGFDIAITEDGPDVVEVNTTRPGFTLWQAAHSDMPLKPVLNNILKK